MTGAAMVRPERDEELRIEEASRDASGPWAYTGTRECPACEADTRPVHPNQTDRQICGNCLEHLPGDPITWAIRDHDGSPMFILRQGDHCVAGGAPQRSGDDDVDRVLAGNVWLNLEHRLQLVTFHQTA